MHCSDLAANIAVEPQAAFQLAVMKQSWSVCRFGPHLNLQLSALQHSCSKHCYHASNHSSAQCTAAILQQTLLLNINSLSACCTVALLQQTLLLGLRSLFSSMHCSDPAADIAVEPQAAFQLAVLLHSCNKHCCEIAAHFSARCTAAFLRRILLLSLTSLFNNEPKRDMRPNSDLCYRNAAVQRAEK